ncbi:MAG: hypothetical protein U9Q69_02805 [Nanoarchaeota archaeon]|nr:hypothetical protein [Nanoarchaeota archaeon]
MNAIDKLLNKTIKVKTLLKILGYIILAILVIWLIWGGIKSALISGLGVMN